MELLIGGAIAAFVAQFGFIWYRLGKVEQKVSDLCREVRANNNTKKGGK